MGAGTGPCAQCVGFFSIIALHWYRSDWAGAAAWGCATGGWAGAWASCASAGDSAAPRTMAAAAAAGNESFMTAPLGLASGGPRPSTMRPRGARGNDAIGGTVRRGPGWPVKDAKGHIMKGALAWLIGIPIPIIILLYVFDVF